MDDIPQALVKIRVQKQLQGLSTHFWRREAPPEVGAPAFLRYFVGRMFSTGFWGRDPPISGESFYLPHERLGRL